jgi:hypothetical protein
MPAQGCTLFTSDMLGNDYVVHDKICFSSFENGVVLGFGLRKYEISRTIEQERNGVSVRSLFEMTSWYMNMSFMWLRIDMIQ